MRAGATSVVGACVALALGACGGSDRGASTTVATGSGPDTASGVNSTRTLPPAAVEPADGASGGTAGAAATEASPEAPPNGPNPSGELPADERAAVATVVRDYIGALDRHDATGVCALLVPGALRIGDLPRRGRGCAGSLRRSIGTRPPAGGPAWRRTRPVESQVERLGDNHARVAATVVHHFSDRKYVSVEDDVIYLERLNGRWLLAKPSGTLYRAVGYPEPPLRALSPPAGWD